MNGFTPHIQFHARLSDKFSAFGRISYFCLQQICQILNKGIIVIPTYNEAENIVLLIQKIIDLPVGFDILIVDDSSPDGTGDLVAAFIKEHGMDHEDSPQRIYLEIRNGKMGLGTAYIHGFKIALNKGYDYIFEMDADFSHNPDDLIPLYEACTKEEYDMSIGSRYVTGVNVINWPIGRVLLSYFASVYVRFITGMPFKDTTAGFKCYHRRVLETINLDSIRFIGYAFQIEMKFTAWKYNFKIKEVPIIFTERTKGDSKMSKRILKEAIWGVISMKINSFFRSYNTLPDQTVSAGTAQSR